MALRLNRDLKYVQLAIVGKLCILTTPLLECNRIAVVACNLSLRAGAGGINFAHLLAIMKFIQREIYAVTAYRLEVDKTIQTKDGKVFAKKGQWVVRTESGVHCSQDQIFKDTFDHHEGEVYWRRGTVVDAYRHTAGKKKGMWFFQSKYSEETYMHDAFIRIFEPRDDDARIYMEATALLCADQA